MAAESKFSLRWKRPSPAVMLVIVITMVGLVISLAFPGLLSSKSEPVRIVFQVRVMDDQGVPIPDANVFVGTASGQTDLEGVCQVAQKYLSRGLSGTCKLEGDLRVYAPGYISWERSLPDLFGRHYNYYHKGATLTHQVTLYR